MAHGARSPVRSLPTAALLSCSVVALATAAVVTVRLVALAPGRGPLLVGVDQVVELGVLAAGAVVAWWLTATVTAAAMCAVAQTLGRRWAAGERFVARHAPAVVRRGLALSVGAGVGLLAAVGPAGAQSADPLVDLGWVATQVAASDSAPLAAPVPPFAETQAAPDAPASTTPDTRSAPPSTSQVTVQAGDSLWAIAARQLRAGASTTEIAAAWPQWYEGNREVVGADPDRIVPGQVLTAPAPAEAAATSAAVPATVPTPEPVPPGAWP